MRPVRRAEGIIDIHIRQLRQRLREVSIILLLFGMEAKIF